MSFKSDKCFGVMSGKPVTSYESEEEALNGIDYIKNHFNKSVPMSFYKCSKCGFYHISPKSRETENELCDCKDEDGKTIQLYDTRKAAIIKATALAKQTGVRHNVYACPKSTGFHVTDKELKENN
ncbi:MAG: hypothetical protein ACRQFF_03375 [Sphaerochaeta sp.]